MADRGHELTDEMLAELEERIGAPHPWGCTFKI